MCLAMPMKINKIDGSLAQCEAGGLTQDIRIDFITDPQCHRENVRKGSAREHGTPGGDKKCSITAILKIRRMCPCFLKK